MAKNKLLIDLPSEDEIDDFLCQSEGKSCFIDRIIEESEEPYIWNMIVAIGSEGFKDGYTAGYNKAIKDMKKRMKRSLKERRAITK